MWIHKNEENSLLAALDKSQAIITFDMNGIIKSANENFLHTFDYDLSEIRGQHHRILVDPEYADSDDYSVFWDQLNRGEFSTAEFQRFGKNNKEVWIQAIYNPIIGKNGKPFEVVKLASDITPRKIQNANFRGQIEAINKSQAVIEFDMNGIILDANANFLAAMGYKLEEIKGQHHRIFVDPILAKDPKYQLFWEKLQRGEYTSAEYQRFGKNKKEVWIQASYNPILDMNRKPIKVVKYATDITARKIQNANFRGQIEAIGKSQAVIEFDMNGLILDANDNFLATMGYKLDELKGQHHRICVDPNYANDPEYELFWERLRAGEYESSEYQRFGKNRKEIWIQASYNPILDMNGKPFKVVKYATDITDLVKAREEVTHLTAKTQGAVQSVAGASQQMQAAIQEISSNMSKSNHAVSDIENKTKHAEELTSKLQDASQSIESVVGIIREIAGQVNLLALNATIEAARAGDAGKGFAVVAGEVKNLASQTAKATDDIFREIQSMQLVSGDVVNSTSAIPQSISSVSEYVNAVAAAVEEQSVATSDVSQSMVEISSRVNELDQCAKQMSGAA